MSSSSDRRSFLVLFQPAGKRGRFPAGVTVLDAARALGVDLDSICGGRGLCGRCQITTAEGSFAKLGIESASHHLEPETEAERRFRQRRGLAAERRLGCQARICGDLVIEVPTESQLHRPLVRKEADRRPVVLDPVVTLHHVMPEPPRLERPRADRERLLDALAAEWGLAGVDLDPALLPSLQKLLRQPEEGVTVAVRNGATVVQIRPGFRDRALGVAVDVGSTTIAAQLCDLLSGEVLAADGEVNPQIRFGEDLMSRVSYALVHEDGAARMTALVREAVDGLVARLASEADAAPDDILEWVVVGNPIMHHLFLGLDPTPLGAAPFTPAVEGAVEMRLVELGIRAAAPGARVHLPPLVAGHVGADCLAAVLAAGIHLGEEITLLVDVGTNAEIVLGNRERLLACSSPTGPALEGAQISCGQRATAGAIERVRIDPETLEPRFRVIGCPLWSDDPDFPAATAALPISGICGSGVIEAIAEMYLAGILGADGRIDPALAARSPRVCLEGRTAAYRLHPGPPEIRITQEDVRAIQLAKAALHAGAELLMERLGVDHVDRVLLAGAFGSHIDPLRAMVLGMIPDCPLERVDSIGNAAGAGARIALLNRAARRELAALAARIEKIETAIEPRFQERFVAALGFPRAPARHPHLARRVTLPAAPRQERRRSRRRRA